MKQYHSIFYTSDYNTTYDIKQLFAQFKIKYRVLFEHRLEPEFFHLPYSDDEVVFQVEQSDYFKAHHLLVSRGYKFWYDKEKDTFRFLNKSYLWLSGVPILNRLSKPLLFYMLFVLILFTPILILAIKADGFALNLEETNWCVVDLVHKDTKINPIPEFTFQLDAKCRSRAEFSKNNTVYLPSGETGTWEYSLNKRAITISMYSNQNSIYSGFYEIKRNWFLSEYELRSEHTYIKLKLVH